MTKGNKGGGTIKTGVTPIVVFAVALGFKGVIDVVKVEVVPTLTMFPNVDVPLPLRVPTPEPPPPNGDVGLVEKPEPPPKGCPKLPPSDCKKNPLPTNTIWIWLTPEPFPNWMLIVVTLGVLRLKTARGVKT
jgi:hypothetical protein